MSLVPVSLPVPQEAVPALLRYAADLYEEVGAAESELLEEDAEFEEEEDEGSSRRRWGTGRSSVRRAYLGGVSVVWRPFLEYLADRPGEWVPWPELCEHIDRTPRQASGMLGAAERRLRQRPPYEKRWNDGVREFRMGADAARYVMEIARSGSN